MSGFDPNRPPREIVPSRKFGGQAQEGRPSKAKTGAERAREYRERKKAVQ